MCPAKMAGQIDRQQRFLLSIFGFAFSRNYFFYNLHLETRENHTAHGASKKYSKIIEFVEIV